MVPITFTNFFLASAGAGGTLIGLLFVAISIAPDRTVTRTASTLRRATSGSAFTALINAFFISLSALLPGENIGYIVLVFGLLSASNSVQMGIMLARQWRSWQDGLRRTVLTVGSIVVYVMEIISGVQMLVNSHDVSFIYTVTTLILVVYGIGLTRSWGLLGAHRQGLLGWLSPLHQDQEKDVPPLPTGKSA